MIGEHHGRVALFVTCIVDQIYPESGTAVTMVLERLGVSVYFPAEQLCCGQPAFNSGFWPEARVVAGRNLEVLRGAGTVVTPSGSCAAMIRHSCPELFADHPVLHAAALDLASRTYEFSEYLVDVLGVTDVGAHFPATLTVHDACHGLRGARVARQHELGQVLQAGRKGVAGLASRSWRGGAKFGGGSRRSTPGPMDGIRPPLRRRATTSSIRSRLESAVSTPRLGRVVRWSC